MNTEENSKGYVTLKEHFNRRIDDTQQLFMTQLIAIREETKLAKENNDKRLEGMNEFRSQLDRQTRTFITRVEHEYLNEQIKRLQLGEANLAGKASQASVVWAYVIAAIGIIIAFLSLIE